MSSALITGGAGFIGSNLADALIADGRAMPRRRQPLQRAGDPRPERGRVPRDRHPRRPTTLTAIARDAAPATIFHLAAQADVRKAVEDPAYDADVNIIGTINVLEAARAVGARVVFASTGGAGYGEYEGLPVPSPETRRDPPAVALRHEQDGRRGLLRPLRAPLRHRDRGAAAGQRLRPAPGPPRRGRRGRHLLRPPARRRAPARSSATASRRATTSTWATSCAPSWPPRPAPRARRSTSAAASR